MRIITTVLFIVSSIVSQAQLIFSTAQLDFSDVLTTADRKLAVDVTNSSNNPVSIKSLSCYDEAFSVAYPKGDIAADGSETILVTFSPTQNLIYNSEAILILSNGNEYRLDLKGAGRYEDTYYSSTFNKSNQALKDELKLIIAKGYTNLGYTTARDRMYAEIDNVNGQVTCAYTGRVATFNTRAGANSNSFNCEHTWPQSLYNKSEPERADIHHLFPTDANTNSRRGNFPFGTVSNATWSEGGSKVGGSLFEPRDAQKGATARAMMYFAIRYENTSNFLTAQENILRQWHADHPPSDRDSIRNEKIFTYQKNRNPFVDHPEFTERIGNISTTDIAPEIKQAVLSRSSIDFSTVFPATQRTIYLVNTGNTDLSGIDKISSKNGALKVIEFPSVLKVGEAIAVTVGFDSLSPGDYKDELRIDLSDQNGQTLTLPVDFNLVASKVSELPQNRLYAYYNHVEQRLSFKNLPSAIREISIYTLGGSRIVLDDISSSFTDIPFSGHSSGLYFAVVKSENDVSTARFLVD